MGHDFDGDQTMSTLYVDNLEPNLGSQVEIPDLKPLAGSVVQDVVGYNDTQYASPATSVYVDTFSFSINNCIAGSHVIVECDPAGLMENAGNVTYVIFKGSTELGHTRHNGTGNGGWRTAPTMIRGTDTNVTSGTNTYTLKFYSTGPYMYVNYNYPDGYRCVSSYRMTEIAQ